MCKHIYVCMLSCTLDSNKYKYTYIYTYMMYMYIYIYIQVGCARTSTCPADIVRIHWQKPGPSFHGKYRNGQNHDWQLRRSGGAKHITYATHTTCLSRIQAFRDVQACQACHACGAHVEDCLACKACQSVPRMPNVPSKRGRPMCMWQMRHMMCAMCAKGAELDKPRAECVQTACARQAWGIPNLTGRQNCVQAKHAMQANLARCWGWPGVKKCAAPCQGVPSCVKMPSAPVAARHAEARQMLEAFKVCQAYRTCQSWRHAWQTKFCLQLSTHPSTDRKGSVTNRACITKVHRLQSKNPPAKIVPLTTTDNCMRVC